MVHNAIDISKPGCKSWCWISLFCNGIGILLIRFDLPRHIVYPTEPSVDTTVTKLTNMTIKDMGFHLASTAGYMIMKPKAIELYMNDFEKTEGIFDFMLTVLIFLYLY